MAESLGHDGRERSAKAAMFACSYSGTNYWSLAEVQVMGTLGYLHRVESGAGKLATQSSSYGLSTGAALAVDGNTNGNTRPVR